MTPAAWGDAIRRRARAEEGGASGSAQLQFEFTLADALAVPVTRLVNDSRRVAPGDTFVAYPGEAVDGRDFIPQAIARGANAVVWEARHFLWDPAWQVPNLPVPGLRDKLGALAAEVCGQPSRALWMVGITGTNGKSSCAHWIAQALTHAGRRSAIIGTLGNGFPGALTPALNTTPDAILLQETLRDYLQRGAQAVAMEVSSHALVQGRVNGTRFDVAVFTNLSRDHLDYHGDMQAYIAAKARLFDWPGLGHAVINADDPLGADFAARARATGARVWRYGFAPAEVQGAHLQVGPAGLRFDVSTPVGCATIDSPLLGRFNAHNLLAVLSVLLASGVTLDAAVSALGALTPVPGRMQCLRRPGAPLVVVDYAHTPDALEKVLLTLREVAAESKSAAADARLVCVFGCGGNRDKGKRPLMGAVASRLADEVVLTSDNPRHEDPRTIIGEISAGMGANYHVIEDRAAAIHWAIAQARPGDVVVIAGKGHEDYQDIAGRRLPFSDVEVASRALEARP